MLQCIWELDIDKYKCFLRALSGMLRIKNESNVIFRLKQSKCRLKCYKMNHIVMSNLRYLPPYNPVQMLSARYSSNMCACSTSLNHWMYMLCTPIAKNHKQGVVQMMRVPNVNHWKYLQEICYHLLEIDNVYISYIHLHPKLGPVLMRCRKTSKTQTVKILDLVDARYGNPIEVEIISTYVIDCLLHLNCLCGSKPLAGP